MVNYANLLLCGFLLFWQPVRMALSASMEIQSLPLRGWPLAIGLVARLVVTAVGVAAGISLFARKPSAATLAKSALVLSAALDALVYFTPIFPNNRMPGQTPVFVTASVLYHAFWLAYLVRLPAPSFEGKPDTT
jgi:hypothetical protein